MRTRSGLQYHFEADDTSDEKTPLPSSSSVVLHEVQPLEPIHCILPFNSVHEHNPNRSRIHSLKRMSMYILNGLVKIASAVPSILATIAGLNAAMQLIQPPEQKIEIKVTQKWFWWK